MRSCVGVAEQRQTLLYFKKQDDFSDTLNFRQKISSDQKQSLYVQSGLLKDFINPVYESYVSSYILEEFTLWDLQENFFKEELFKRKCKIFYAFGFLQHIAKIRKKSGENCKIWYEYFRSPDNINLNKM